MSPIELLQKQLKEYEDSLQKSKEAYVADTISFSQHATHRANLMPMICRYRTAILLLKESYDRKATIESEGRD